MSKIKIAVVADLHFSRDKVAIPERIGHCADDFLARLVQRFNTEIRPDIVLLAGDLLDNHIDSKNLYKRLKDILSGLDVPYIAIPGNHDCFVDFYAEFGKLPEYLDINGFRVIPFDDPGLPGFHAVRLDEEFERMKKSAAEFPGPVISLQHVPLIEADKNPCREHYTNANEIIASLQEINGGIAISGHAHAGIAQPVASGNTYSIVVPGLCEKPHQYAIIDADTDLNVKMHIEQL